MIEEWVREEPLDEHFRDRTVLEVDYADNETVVISRRKLTRILLEAGYELQEEGEE